MDNSSLTKGEYVFLENLIGIESTGASEVKEPSLGTLPYGSAPLSALKFFLDDASEAGMRTGIIENRVGWCEFGPLDADDFSF